MAWIQLRRSSRKPRAWRYVRRHCSMDPANNTISPPGTKRESPGVRARATTYPAHVVLPAPRGHDATTIRHRGSSTALWKRRWYGSHVIPLYTQQAPRRQPPRARMRPVPSCVVPALCPMQFARVLDGLARLLMLRRLGVSRADGSDHGHRNRARHRFRIHRPRRHPRLDWGSSYDRQSITKSCLTFTTGR